MLNQTVSPGTSRSGTNPTFLPGKWNYSIKSQTIETQFAEVANRLADVTKQVPNVPYNAESISAAAGVGDLSVNSPRVAP